MKASAVSYKKSSFGPAFLFLDKQRREALAVYYAFCRLMDDIADEPDVKDPQKELDFWQNEIKRVFNGTAQTELGQEIQKITARFDIKADRFLLLIEGMEADVQGRRYSDWADLEWYLWRVAGIVGLATLDILGIKGPKAEELAYKLGSAIQLTNIVRDVHEDAAMGRIYLPEDLLHQYGLTRQTALWHTCLDALAGVLKETAQRAKVFYKEAMQISGFDTKRMLPCRVMACIYRANLAKIEKKDFIFERAVKLSKFEKMIQCIYALFKINLFI